jgi:hypothetical protein
MAAFPVFWIGIQLAIVRMPLGNWLLILPFDLVAVAFFGYGVSGLLELPARWRASRGDPVLAVVEPEGLRMVGMGHLTWGRIAAVRVAASDIATNEGSPPIRRLEVVPTDPGRLEDRPWSDRAYDRLHGLTRRLNSVRRRAARAPGAFGLDLDLLEDPEGLLDAIARYCLVDERG